MQKRLICLGCTGIVGTVLFILGLVTIFFFDPYVDTFIHKELVLQNGTKIYKTWKDPPVVPYLHMYFFNISNEAEFLRGDKPIVQEIGPYSYREHWQKVNVSFFDNGTVTYQTQRFYFFDADKSKGTEDDMVSTLNIPMITAVMQLRFSPRFVKLALSSMLEVLKEKPIVHHTIAELMWGYEDKLIKLAKDILPPNLTFPFDKFGFFYEKNGSSDGVFNVFTGADDIKKYTTVDLFNHERDLTFWGTEECNRIKGTDGTSFPPNLSKRSVLYMFNENLCRSLPLVYSEDVEHYGVRGYRFVPPKDVFAYPSITPENACYCVGGPPCLGGGVFNVSVCKYGSPTMISWPHFYQADQKYLDAVIGLNPDPLKHGMYVDVAPRIGVPLRAQARLQINMAMTAVPEIKQAMNLTTMIFPVCWFEDGVANMPDDLIEMIQMAQNLPEVTKTTVLSLFFGIGGALLIAVLVAFIANLFSIQMKFLNPSPKINPTSDPATSNSNENNKYQIRGYSNPSISDNPETDRP